MYAKPKYSLEEWNCYRRVEDDLQRTTNLQEAFHYKLQSCSTHGDHPGIVKLVRLLLDLQSSVERAMCENLKKGCVGHKKSKKAQEKEKNIKMLVQNYEEGKMAKLDYLYGIQANFG